MELLLSLLLLTTTVFAEYESPLEEIDPPINDLHFTKGIPSSSDVLKNLQYHTPARSQGSRGTCTMFTTIGMIENLLIKEGLYDQNIDLSEEWMEYIIMKDKQSEGSSTSKNLRAAKNMGIVFEKTWPYLGKKWLELTDYTIARDTCGHLIKDPVGLQSCLLGHRDPYLFTMEEEKLKRVDPEFLVIRKEANTLREKYIRDLYPLKKSYKIKTVSKIKKKLNEGHSLIMGTKLYYGSWNSLKTNKLEIQERDKDKYYRGIVTYPEPGSRDRRISGEKGGGHSIIIIGYDDNVVVRSRMLMEDGTWKDFEYRGVYYFKNSWGYKVFGKKFEINGKRLPGHGMITQKYAHEFGTFFSLK